MYRVTKYLQGKSRTWSNTLVRPKYQDRDRLPALVNAVMNLRVPQNVGNFLAS